jgi:transcriptional regulator with XRE-family HTH domain
MSKCDFSLRKGDFYTENLNMGEKLSFIGLKNFRKRKGWQQSELAEILKCGNVTTYNNWETGKREPRFAIIQQLFELGASVEELFGVPYTAERMLPKDLKMTKEQATEVVKAGLQNLINTGGIVVNSDVLKNVR